MPVYLQDPEFVGKHMLNMAGEIRDLRDRLAQLEVSLVTQLLPVHYRNKLCQIFIYYNAYHRVSLQAETQ